MGVIADVGLDVGVNVGRVVARTVGRACARRPWLGGHRDDLRQECALLLWVNRLKLLKLAETGNTKTVAKAIVYICRDAINGYQREVFGLMKRPSKFSETRRAVHGHKEHFASEDFDDGGVIVADRSPNPEDLAVRADLLQRLNALAFRILGPKQYRALHAEGSTGAQALREASLRLQAHKKLRRAVDAGGL